MIRQAVARHRARQRRHPWRDAAALIVSTAAGLILLALLIAALRGQ